ncbi:hypothetical protein A2852_02210 [Candidatus Adlerbacteria bacterium RIFCSPHIGHO2_01_FULL_54_23]|uniref:UDP-N-acetylmuramoyl-tripeptide--D-alanyl-D-alanine ligase n=3 Tax=Candidatus Adleribacteriota TaxID=1752736 RepID=A0A1F4Y0T8_9BACT|nr:MAG: UDP-N-acetylmuramoyl-tripeptide-D-alanyl-D-alanine ligase [Candidatus Adlerbacteria bacterium GW2011_GWA1_54_10]KKW37933.1 MAG: UDP-N-acetylmuramoyl-tripeptide-D-alanyl-D-alanine ligase [Candidatus Adlerbacteria bacterium GW2011_GWB1_54_7]OGC78542.1 MAG: hypothetical protein A2852_02210 [Candidatus Adlerbacteria bacterium RIFCSPHIGHO2_01_FULL_54_23]OGC87552.1 MAG: hypothetical protein A3B33_01405 [Candidatus Adlerbacteria bacterium RIFCSPLOWO2_01_FULL_54_16]
MRTIFKKIIVSILTAEARAVLKKYRPKVVVVTGSVGKTSAKDAIYSVLSRGHHVRKSEKSFNSEVGLPLTILGVPNAWQNPLGWLRNIIDGFFLLAFDSRYPEWMVLEAGADRPGDIRSLAGWLSVDIAVITRLPEIPVHVEYFDSPEQLMEEKASIIDAVKPGGTLILYGDDERTRALEHRLPAPDAKILTFGFKDGNDVRGEDFEILFEESSGRANLPVGMTGKVHIGGESLPVEIVGTVGLHASLPLLAAAAIGNALDKDMETIAEGLKNYEAPPGRMRLLRGVKETLIIDDTYNSSPAAVVAALDTLALLKGRKIAVLGDMLELGRHSVEEHRKVGAHAAKTCGILATVGFRARDIAQGALDAGLGDADILQYEDSQKAGGELQNLLQAGDCVLVKGSQSMRMERVVEEIMADPSRAGELLVRQDAEWKKR